MQPVPPVQAAFLILINKKRLRQCLPEPPLYIQLFFLFIRLFCLFLFPELKKGH